MLRSKTTGIDLKTKSFKLKLILSYALVVLFSFALTAFFLIKNLEQNSLRNIQSSLVTQAKLIENQISPDYIIKEDFSYLDVFAKRLAKEAGCRITVIDTNGTVLADSDMPREDVPGMENHSYRPEIKIALLGNTGIDIRYSPTLKIDMLYVALPLKYKSEIIGSLRVSIPLGNVQKTLFEIKRIFTIGLLFALCFAFILGSVFAIKTIEPINKMIRGAREFSKGNFNRRIAQSSKDEIGELAATLNKMAEEIENRVKDIKTQNQKLAAIFNSMIEGIIVVDRGGYIASLNPTIEKIFGISLEKAKGKLFLETIRNNDIHDIINKALEKGEPVCGEISLIYPVQKVFEVSATPIFDNNAVSGCLAVIHDITEIRRLETIRSDFVANVSHELKTPLTSIKGFVETLLEGALEDKDSSRQFLKIVQDHTQRLDNLVNDLLILSNLESREISIEKNNIKLRQLAGEVILGFTSQLNKKGIEIKNDLPDDLTIKADKNRIEQVFTNLIDNAIKFNKEKGIIKIYGHETNGTVRITVEDSGMGIPGKDVGRIFERFYRVDKARSRELGGTGLGLSIVKHIIELHEGSVGVESVEGLGSKFWFTLPK